MKMLQKFNHEGINLEVINLNGRSLFNAAQVGNGLWIEPSSVRTAVMGMEDGSATPQLPEGRIVSKLRTGTPQSLEQ